MGSGVLDITIRTSTETEKNNLIEKKPGKRK